MFVMESSWRRVKSATGAAGDKLWECEHNYVYTSEGSGSDVYFDCASPR